jgi:hypothetical protein
MIEFLKSTVLPEWSLILSSISVKERRIGVIQRGTPYVWTTLFKDIRRFYRLIFKHRFHRCDKRKDSKRQLLVSTILKNLGILEYDYDVNQIFNFFYPVLDKLRKGNSSANKNESEKDYFSQVFVTYSKENTNKFLKNNIGSQLI